MTEQLQKRQIVFATNNKHKLQEIRHLLGKDYYVASLAELGCTEDIPETADTLEGNALIKARYLSSIYNIDCFADDTGLEVDSLGGRPGVFSARYAGEEQDSEANVQKLLEEMQGETNRKARFRTVVVLILGNREYYFDGIVNGQITTEKHGTAGFGYDPVFVPDGYEITFAQMSMQDKNQISHRGRAINKLVHFLENQAPSS